MDDTGFAKPVSTANGLLGRSQAFAAWRKAPTTVALCLRLARPT